ncbi:MAG: bifunctional adenosylcobinamide kinase/adenosylcobinamide-phosphate guanylyltransferase [Acidimicrobiia bacterium]
MPFTFLIGGARSGKSSLAVRLGNRARGNVVFIATAIAGDDEMAQRIADHQAGRPGSWSTIEEPRHLNQAIKKLVPTSFVILDCLTLWVNNLFVESPEEGVLAEADSVARALADRAGEGVVVSNEVGLGIVPFDAETRRYRDLLGRVNALFSSQAADSFFLAAGRATRLEEMPM